MRLLASTIALLLAASTAFAQDRAGRLEGITRTKTIKIAHRTDATPFSFINNRQEITGYSIDFCKRVVDALQRQLGVDALRIEWVPVTTQTRFEVIANGKADLECGASTVTLARMKQVDFSSVIFIDTTGFVVRKSAGISTANELSGKKIAVIAGTSNESAVSSINGRLKASIVPVKDRAAGYELLENSQVDAFASDKILLLGGQVRDGQSLVMLPENLSVEPYAIAMPRGDWALRLAVNSALAEIFKKGEARLIFDQWFAVIGASPTPLLEIYLFAGGPA